MSLAIRRIRPFMPSRFRGFSSVATESDTTVDLFKQAMSGVAASATIITTNHYVEKDRAEPRGLTVSSLSSLSIRPKTLVSFNLQVPSRTSQVLHDRRVFAVNILPATSESIELCKAFAGVYGRHVNPFERFKERFEFQDDRLEDDHDSSGIPTISNASAVLYCKKRQVFRVQDHEIWIAQVYHIKCNEGHERGNLLYQNRVFHRLGDEIL
ncbi:hypothetical protein TRVA0_057S00672 [Trichomonascus vanleenenianus]|uniref:flavin reductase family protein n=1 Tax=Trichomonascus vanleenenianus TaxID=2268995 RepID=UPI003ECAABB0